MGRPKDGKERELRRAREELAKGLQRHDGGRAAEALVQLPPDARTAHLAEVASLFAAEVQRAQAARNQAELAKLSAAAAQEPRLLAAISGMARLAVSWALLWGAARRSDWTAVAEFAEWLRPELAQRSPALARWLDAWVRTQGAIPAAEELPPLPAGDERLGYERVPLLRAPAAPETAEQVEPAVLTAAATLRPPDFRALMFTWTRSLPPPLGRAVRGIAGQLAMYEALRGAPSRRHLAPLSLLAAMAVEPPTKPSQPPALITELGSEVMLGLRLLNACRGNEMTAEEARLFSALLLAAAQDPQQRERVIAYAATLRFPPEAHAQAAKLHEQLLSSDPNPDRPLWANAVEQWMQAEVAGPPPSWLLRALERLAAGPGVELAGWLHGLDPTRRSAVFDFLVDEAPPLLGLDLADRAWAAAEPRLRPELARLVVSLIEALPDDDAHSISSVRTVGDCLKLMERLSADDSMLAERALRELPPQLPLPEDLRHSLTRAMRREGLLRDEESFDKQQRGQIQRFAERLLPESRGFAELALRAAPSEADAARVARSHLEHAAAIEDALALLYLAYTMDRRHTQAAIIECALGRWGKDAAALARALLRLHDEAAPRPIQLPFARALLQADREFTGDRNVLYMAALCMSHRLVPAKERKALGIPNLRSVKPAGKQTSARPRATKSSKKPAAKPADKPRTRRRPSEPADEGGALQAQLDLHPGL